MSTVDDNYQFLMAQGPERALEILKKMPLLLFEVLIKLKARDDMHKFDYITRVLDGAPMCDVVAWLLSMQLGGVVTTMPVEWRKVMAALLRRGAEAMEAIQDGEQVPKSQVPKSQIQ